MPELTTRQIAEAFPVSVFIKEELQARDWSNAEFAARLGARIHTVHLLLTNGILVTPRLAQKIGDAFGTGPDIWLNLESAYREWFYDREMSKSGK